MGHALIDILSRRSEALGPNDGDTLVSKSGLGWYFREKQDHRTALKYCQEAMKGRKQLFGMCHPKTARSMIDVAWAHYHLGTPSIHLFEEAVEVAARVFAQGNPDRREAVRMLKYLRTANVSNEPS